MPAYMRALKKQVGSWGPLPGQFSFYDESLTLSPNIGTSKACVYCEYALLCMYSPAPEPVPFYFCGSCARAYTYYETKTGTLREIKLRRDCPASDVSLDWGKHFKLCKPCQRKKNRSYKSKKELCRAKKASRDDRRRRDYMTRIRHQR